MSATFSPAYISLTSGLCTGSSHDPALIGRWVFSVAVVEDDGTELQDYIGADRHAADTAAVGLARDFGIRIVDRSEEAPR